MEKRLLLAIVLSFLILVLWQAVFVKKPSLPESIPEAITETGEMHEQIPPQEESPPPPPLEPAEEEFLPLYEELEKQITIDTSLYRAVWSNRGGVLRSWKLKQHTDDNGEELEIVSPISDEIKKYPFHLNTEDPEFDSLINSALYTISGISQELKEGQTGEIRFQYADEKGTRVEKVFSFAEGTYDFAVQIHVWKNGQEIEPRLLWGPGFSSVSPEAEKKRFGGATGIAVFSGDKVYRNEERKYKPEKSFFNFVSWAAYENNYFTALFLTSPQKTSAVFLKEEAEQIPIYFLSINHVQRAYIGPKDLESLSHFGYDAKKLIKFGFFGWIAEILLKAIKAIHRIFPNWGFSIIILTFLIKVLFFPLTYSSTRSMAKMQELQPKMKAIRAKYKKAKQDIAQRRKMNEEIMKLYKEQGINPAGGCLPILIQLPIFWGFFRMLVVSIEFRHSPFILWIRDLSLKDPFYVTPILMGITQFISQKMTPTSADPTQQRMMLIMPVVMTIFFMNFQSGLVLYWLTNNVLQIGQQYIMNRLMHKKKRELHGKRRKK